MIVALVPMKGHSERVPGKNLRQIAGRPLFAWIVSSLLATARVDQVVVDTDDDRIQAAVRDEFGSEVRTVRRPERLRGDFVAMHDIVSHLCSTLEGDTFLQTHSTNPLLSPKTISAAIEAYEQRTEEHDSLMGVTPRYSRFYWEDGTPINHHLDNLIRTQDLPPLMEENSNLYIASRSLIETTGKRVGRRPILFPIAADEAWDIDEELDFSIANFLLTLRHG